MYCHKSGLHFPGNSEGATHEVWDLYDEESGMHYDLWKSDGNLILGAYHDAVGLTTWYEIDREYWKHLVSQVQDQ